MRGEVVQLSGSAETWAALAGAPMDQGSYTVDVTALGDEISDPDGGPGQVFLDVRGTIDCTMPALTVTGATGTVTLTATF